MKHSSKNSVKKSTIKCCTAKSRRGDCQKVAGWGTNHPGIGLCRFHGGRGGRPSVDVMTQEKLRAAKEFWNIIPVDSKTFFKDYLFEPCYPRQQEYVDSILGTDPLTWDSTYTEAIALVGKGGGKDRTISKILTYAIYKLLCMKNPQRFLGLNDNDLRSPESAIDVGNVSLNRLLAQNVFFKNFVTMVKNTTNPDTQKNWFEEQGLNLGTDILKREIKFPKAITAYSLDSVDYTGEGLNLLIVIYDEVGGFEPKKASELYTALTSTQKTRFGDKRKTMLLSYKRNDNDFMLIRYEQAKKERKTFRVRAATWDWNTKRRKQDFSEDYFKNPEDSKRIYECKGTTNEGGYFKYQKRIKESVNPNRLNPIVNELIWTDKLLKLRFKDFFIPKRYQPYYVHIDLAKGKESGDYCGIALGHPVRNKAIKLNETYLEELRKIESIDLTATSLEKQISVVIDLVLQVRARPGQEIIFDEVREFLHGLKKVGYDIKMVTFDGWQSIDSIQLLRKIGMKAELLSTDKNTKAYDTLKEQMYKGLLDIYEHPIFIRECEELIRKKNNKVDHPDLSFRRSLEEGRKEGSKDVSDAVAGCTFLCIEYGKTNFSFGLTGSVNRQYSGFRRPDEDEKDKLVFYGERP